MIKNQKLIIVQGFIAAGKTTYSKKIAYEHNAVRLNGDEYCENNFSEDELNSNWDNCYSIAITNLYKKAKEFTSSGNNIILDFGFWDKKSRDYARNFAKENELEFVHIFLDTPEKIIIERLKQRSGVIAENNLDNFKKLQSYFERPSVDEEHIAIYNK